MSEDDDFCPICMIEGRHACEEHGEDAGFDDRDDWDDFWHRDNFEDA